MSIMTNSTPSRPRGRIEARRLIIGVDTHKDFHVAAAVEAHRLTAAIDSKRHRAT